jgi:chromosome segregation ATPase
VQLLPYFPKRYFLMNRFWIIAAMCIPATLRAEDVVTRNEQSPPIQNAAATPAEALPTPPIRLETCYPLPLPPLAVMLAYRDAALRATNPLSLEDQLAIAQRHLQEKTAAAMPLIAAVSKAEAELAPAQAVLAAAQQEAATLQKNIDALTLEVTQITESRATNDAERNKVAATLTQLQGAQPLVAEALRHLTEAVGKAPTDTTLTDAHRQLTEKLKTMETNVADLQTKTNEFAAAVTAADVRLKETAARLDAARQQSAAVAARVATLQTESEKLAAAFDAAQKAAEPAQSEVNLAQRQVERWRNEIAYRDLLASLEADLAAASILADERQAELDQANQQLAVAQSAAASANGRLNEATRNVDAINARIQSARDEHQSREHRARSAE